MPVYIVDDVVRLRRAIIHGSTPIKAMYATMITTLSGTNQPQASKLVSAPRQVSILGKYREINLRMPDVAAQSRNSQAVPALESIRKVCVVLLKGELLLIQMERVCRDDTT